MACLLEFLQCHAPVCGLECLLEKPTVPTIVLLAGLGSLLMEAAEWLSAFLPVPLSEDSFSIEGDEVSITACIRHVLQRYHSLLFLVPLVSCVLTNG